MGCSQILTSYIQEKQVDLVSMGCSHILTVGIHDQHVELVLMRLVDMAFNEMFLDPHCGYTGQIGGSSFNQIGGHRFQ